VARRSSPPRTYGFAARTGERPARKPSVRVRKRRPTTDVLPTWIAEHISGDNEASGAILRAAAELMSEHSPSQVSLREIASKAGVNYGLIHRHFGTKHRLLVALFQEFVLYGGQYIRASDTIDEAIEGTFTADPGGWARIFSWVALDGVPPEQTFRDGSIMANFQALIRAAWDQGNGDPPQRRDEFDPRVVSSFVMMMISIWDLYAPYMRQVDAWTTRDLDDARAEVLELMKLLVHAARPAPGPTPRRPRG
jgi:AcrR family transcriptional regulator